MSDDADHEPQSGGRSDGPDPAQRATIREALAARAFGRWPTWGLTIVVSGAVGLILAGIYRLGAGDFSAAAPTVAGVVLAALSATILSRRRRARRPPTESAAQGPAAGRPATLDTRWGRYLAYPEGRPHGAGRAGETGPFGDPAESPPWAEPFTAQRSRDFPQAEQALVEVLRAALHSSPHFVLSEVHAGGATVHRRTQRAFLGERIQLEFFPAGEGTTVLATFRPLSPASVGTASGAAEIDLLFRTIADHPNRPESQ